MNAEYIGKIYVSDLKKKMTKKLIKNNAYDIAFQELQTLKEGHYKVNDNVYAYFKH